MSVSVIIAFILGTGMEMISLTMLAANIGIMNSLSEIMFSLLTGVFISRSWGSPFYEKLKSCLKSREMPSNNDLEGVMLTVSGLFLITPGLVTDALALLIIFPPTRELLKKPVESFIRKKVTLGGPYYFFKG